MRCKNKVRLRIRERKAKLCQLLLRPFPRRHDFPRNLLKIRTILYACLSAGNRQAVHCIGVEGKFDII